METAESKEVCTSQTKIHELEMSIRELKHSTDSLSLQNAADRRHIERLLETIEVLENESSAAPDHPLVELENEKRHRILDSTENKAGLIHHDDIVHQKNFIEFYEKYVNLSTQIDELRTTRAKDQKIIENQRDQISVLLKENNYLQEQFDDQLHNKDEELKTLREELATFDQIRLGNLCKHCHSSITPTQECSNADELSLVLAKGKGEEEYVERTMSALFNSAKSTFANEGNRIDNNPYRILVEMNDSDDSDDGGRVENIFNRKMSEYEQQVEE